MGRYLRAAFWAAPTVPGLGRVPLNALAFFGLLILGFGHPGFWLLALALETAWLFALSNNDRFRKLVDAEAAQIETGVQANERASLAARLADGARARHAQLRERCERIGQLEREAQVDDFLIESNREAIEKLTALHLNLLIAQQTLHSLDSERAEQEIQLKLETIKGELSDPSLSGSLRESKEATRRILQQRLANLARREETLDEIDSDLTRIEAQIDLALDNAGLRGKREAISANIKLASQLLDDSSGFSFEELQRGYSSATE